MHFPDPARFVSRSRGRTNWQPSCTCAMHKKLLNGNRAGVVEGMDTIGMINHVRAARRGRLGSSGVVWEHRDAFEWHHELRSPEASCL